MSAKRSFADGRGEAGFTLVELMWTMVIFSILAGISMLAVRTYSLKQSLEQAQGDVVAQLNNVQARSVAQSNPIIFGIHFHEGSPNWEMVRFSAGPSSSTSDDTCTASALPDLGAGVAFSSGTQFEAASFSIAGPPTNACMGQVPFSSGENFVFFFPRGSATAGSVTVGQPRLEGQTRTITVSAITGRVDH
ncbi:MAG TPA: prepilin-type N-terminal cleavage/methylation domain-containing protein [Actinomycetota bacterium]|nr:prepilin-type N-terminal cleavage/methylation domain-containing protein [Actinomycetota bacterium]